MPTRRTVLILSASMGAGHDAVAAELARRLSAGGVDAEVADVLELLPLRLGAGLRRWYGWMMRSAPWLYALIYRVFFTPGRTPPVSPLTLLAAAGLRRLVRRRPPSEVVSTFHLAAQAAGHLRRRGLLRAPSTVLLTDFAAHRLWLHPGNDRYLCPDEATARTVRAATGRPAACHAPVVRPEFRRPGPGPDTGSTPGPEPDNDPGSGSVPDNGPGTAWLPPGVRAGERLVLVSAGSWGVGEVEETAGVLAGSGRYVPVVLCGRNRELRRRLARTAIALGWCDDMPGLMAAAYALVDNAAGLTCREAMAAGVPVLSCRPIPGHGRDGVLAMARAGLSVYVPGPGELSAALDRLGRDGERDRRAARAAALFAAPPVESFFGLADPLVPGR
ncbi:MGDG synthase family glycosyltransferase [Streptosporangium sandarakinum]|uniref:MGDG synthase family glycosyltransferase n=1 Tax=Streptosporangium sandarakinum TaxID=1260955 RepID=UPI0034462540